MGLRLLANSSFAAALAAFGWLAITPALAAPPGDLPFGAYDPDGDFVDDPVPVIEHLFLPWEDVYLPSLNDADAYAQARGRALLITLEPWTWSRNDRNEAGYLQKAIFSGAYDENMRTICGTLASLKSNVTLRWAHEMDDDNGQFIWAGWPPETYIKAYRRMITICKDVAPNISYMWSPLGDEGMEAYYPGDDLVDIVGISVFGLQKWDQDKYGHDRTYQEIMAPRYTRAATFGKPVVVAELGYSGTQAYVDDWENTVRVSRADQPQLVGVVYFDQKEVYPWPEDYGLPDWRLNYRVLK
ncbi:MAG: glycosyl hydrolase [Paracoccaceae bacterium]